MMRGESIGTLGMLGNLSASSPLNFV